MWLGYNRRGGTEDGVAKVRERRGHEVYWHLWWRCWKTKASWEDLTKHNFLLLLSSLSYKEQRNFKGSGQRQELYMYASVCIVENGEGEKNNSKITVTRHNTRQGKTRKWKTHETSIEGWSGQRIADYTPEYYLRLYHLRNLRPPVSWSLMNCTTWEESCVLRGIQWGCQLRITFSI